MYNDLDTINAVANTASNIGTWMLVSFILAIAGGILTYFLFIKSNNKYDEKITKFRDFLDFKTMIIEPITKISYLVITLFVMIFSFMFIEFSFVTFILFFTLGPIFIRITYEAVMMFIMIWRNTKDISDKLNKNRDK